MFALRYPLFALAMIGAVAGVWAGALDAWPHQPQGSPKLLQMRVLTNHPGR